MANVRVELLQGDISLGDETVACGSGGVSWDDLDDGDYTLHLTGLNSSGEELYRATADFTVPSRRGPDVIYRYPLGSIRRFRLRARLGSP